MRKLVVVALFLVIGACQQSATPRDTSERFVDGPLTGAEVDEFRRNNPGMTALCLRRLRAYGINGLSGISTEQCFEMAPQQQWVGVWRNDFEGSGFCPGEKRRCEYSTTRDDIWLTIPKGLPQYEMQGAGGQYQVKFVGRRTLHRGMFGHMGMNGYEIIVDRMISMKQIEAPDHPSSG